MMMNRDKLGFWARLIAIFLALVFILSFIFLGIGGNVSYNLFDLINGQDQQEQSQTQDTLDQQIQAAKNELDENPDDPGSIKQLAGLYFTAQRYDDAEKLLVRGKEVAPDDPDMTTLLAQVYSQQAVSAEGEKQDAAYTKAAEEYIAATKQDPDNAELYAAAGESYEQAGDVGRAIQYYNAYLDEEPDGQYADAVKQNIERLLANTGEETTGAVSSDSGSN